MSFQDILNIVVGNTVGILGPIAAALVLVLAMLAFVAFARVPALVALLFIGFVILWLVLPSQICVPPTSYGAPPSCINTGMVGVLPPDIFLVVMMILSAVVLFGVLRWLYRHY